MMMKRKSSSSREAMERTEFSRDATRLLREFQYLGTGGAGLASSTSRPTAPPSRGFGTGCNALLSALSLGQRGGGAWLASSQLERE